MSGSGRVVSELHVTDTGGGGPTVVFLHGNPTSSYLWRHVIGALGERFRCVAVDLIGMGESPKPPIAYDWNDHRRYLTPVLDRLDAPFWLVGHDWGIGLALEYARTRSGRVRGVAIAEGHLRPLASWDEFDEGGRELFRLLRDPVEGRRMVEDDNVFLSTVLPGGTIRELTPQELSAYAAPYPTPQSRHPIWKWVTQIPIAGDPPETHRVLTANWEWLGTTDTPVMLLAATPGAVLGPEQVRRISPRVRIRNVGEGLHFLPEDRPAEIAAELTEWMH
ncbi:haloalkane dehalogenase [Actinoplanes sp. LDG1-06]|uniref:Haloalkane dehalogenase n=1 Tax=Paractinoplanes ovalisporus TaxID=2810368 RepID=A0ABS2AIG3_9ACTN|nr:haloalkane dehalogenase [Actinoplanes ovalisporus]MBM2619637.1 haloalkane dehalogenase [Actinoplanes ovalisporus]